MVKRDIKSNVKTLQSLAPAARATSATGTAVDTRGYDSVAFVVDIGDWQAGAFTFKAMESDNEAASPDDFTQVDASDLDGTMPVVDGEADDLTMAVVGYKGAKRYVRVDVDEPSSPNPTAMPCSAHVLLGHPHGAPTT